MRAIMEYSPSIIYVKDLSGRYLLVNDEFARATGIEVDEAVGRTAAECWPNDIETDRRGRAATPRGRAVLRQ